MIVTASFNGKNGVEISSASFPSDTSVGDIMVWAATVRPDAFGFHFDTPFALAIAPDTAHLGGKTRLDDTLAELDAREGQH